MTTDVDVQPCPKCGSTEGWNGPTYHLRSGYFEEKHRRYTFCADREYLAFTCRTCGYVRLEPTKDDVGPPPPPDPSTDPGYRMKLGWRWPWSRGGR